MRRIPLLLIILLGFPSCLTWQSFSPVPEDAGDRSDGKTSNNNEEWWDDQWPTRRIISIPAELTTTTLTDVPVFVPTSIQEPLRFVSGDQVVSHEFDEEGYWVKIPSVDEQGATIALYYGNENADVAENAPDVWSNGYLAVWHFDEELIDADAGGQPYFEDSVSQMRIVQNEAFARSFLDPGYIGNCLYVRDEIESDFEAVGLDAMFPQDALTVEIWHTFRQAGPTNRRIFGAGDPAFIIEMSDGGVRVAARGDSSRLVQWVPEDDVWTKMSVVLGPVDPRRTISVFLNDDDPMESIPLSIDWRPSNQLSFIGTPSTLDFRYDEFRFSNVARTDAWVRFQARVEAKPSPVVVGPEESR